MLTAFLETPLETPCRYLGPENPGTAKQLTENGGSPPELKLQQTLGWGFWCR